MNDDGAVSLELRVQILCLWDGEAPAAARFEEFLEVPGAGVGLVEDFGGGHAHAEGEVRGELGLGNGCCGRGCGRRDGCAGALFGDEEGGAVGYGWEVLSVVGNTVLKGMLGLPIPLANMLPFTKASLNAAMLMPSSSMTSLAGLPEKSLEKRWSKSIRSCAICLRSAS